MRLMFDAVTATNIPRSATMVAGYVDQITSKPWSVSDWELFPYAVHVAIVKKASSVFGDVLDVETGDASPSEAPGWVSAMRTVGLDPTVYCNFSTWNLVQSAFAATGVQPPHYWIAKYDDVASIPPSWVASGCVAKQYKNTPGYDLSIVADYWPGVDPTTIPATGNEDPMLAPASTDDYIDVPTDGRRNLYISSSYGRHVTVLDVVCVGDTPGPVGADYIADGLTTLDILPDRPGALPLPAGVRVTKVRYSAVHPFTIWTA